MKLLAVAFLCIFSIVNAASVKWSSEEECMQMCSMYTSYLSSGKSSTGPLESANAFCATNFDGMPKKCGNLLEISKMVHLYVKAGVAKGPLCRKMCRINIESKPLEGSNKSCEICQMVVKYVNIGFKIFNQSEGEIIKEVDQICDTFVKGPLCKKIASYVDLTIRLIMKGLMPGEICVQLGFCNQNEPATASALEKGLFKIFGERAETDLTSYMKAAAELPSDMSFTINRYVKKNEKETMGLKDSSACKICKMVANIVYYSIKYANSTIEAVEEAIKVACDLQPKPIKDRCLFYLKKVDEIVQFVEKGLMPAQICKKLGMCNESSIIEKRGFWKEQHQEIKSESRSICRACDEFENVIRKELRSFNKDARRLKKYFKGMLGNDDNQELRKKRGSLVLVMGMLDSSKVRALGKSRCKKVLCNQDIMIVSKFTSTKKSTACDVCKYSVKLLDKNLGDLNELMQQIMSEVEKACEMVKGKQFSRKCHKYVDAVKDSFKAIISKLKTIDFCTLLDICKSKGDKRIDFDNIFDTIISVSSKFQEPLCNVCKQTVEMARTGKAGGTAFRIFCSKVAPASGIKLCREHDYETLANRAHSQSPEEFCKKLKLCKNTKIAKFVGGILKHVQNMFG